MSGRRPSGRRAAVLLLAAPVLLGQSAPPERPPQGGRFETARIQFGQGRVEFPQGRVEWPRGPVQFATFRIATPEVRGPEARFRLTADVLFDFDRAELRPQAEGVLRDVARQLRERGARVAIRVEGHTDGLGTDAYNDSLSLRRAEAVRGWLAGPGGLPRGAIEAQGFGRRQPAAPNARPDGSDDPIGRQQNRRVEIVAAQRR
jgi:outer membrane protein OmpA-like peptidoglycan-associated protein